MMCCLYFCCCWSLFLSRARSSCCEYLQLWINHWTFFSSPEKLVNSMNSSLLALAHIKPTLIVTAVHDLPFYSRLLNQLICWVWFFLFYLQYVDLQTLWYIILDFAQIVFSVCSIRTILAYLPWSYCHGQLIIHSLFEFFLSFSPSNSFWRQIVLSSTVLLFLRIFA